MRTTAGGTNCLGFSWGVTWGFIWTGRGNAGTGATAIGRNTGGGAGRAGEGGAAKAGRTCAGTARWTPAAGRYTGGATVVGGGTRNTGGAPTFAAGLNWFIEIADASPFTSILRREGSAVQL
jgi:hypothetical protein